MYLKLGHWNQNTEDTGGKKITLGLRLWSEEVKSSLLRELMLFIRASILLNGSLLVSITENCSLFYFKTLLACNARLAHQQLLLTWRNGWISFIFNRENWVQFLSTLSASVNTHSTDTKCFCCWMSLNRDVLLDLVSILTRKMLMYITALHAEHW